MNITFVDIQPFLRLIGAYIVLHIIVFFVEWYRFKHSHLSWFGFKKEGMLGITYILCSLDLVLVIDSIIFWCLFPILSKYAF